MHNHKNITLISREKQNNFMRKGAIPVPHIIALVLGIVVIGLLAFWFFILGGRIPGEDIKAQCEVKRNTYCTQRATCGYAETCSPGDWASYAPGCTDIGVDINDASEATTRYDCNFYVFGLRATGSPCTSDGQCASGDCQTEGEDPPMICT